MESMALEQAAIASKHSSWAISQIYSLQQDIWVVYFDAATPYILYVKVIPSEGFKIEAKESSDYNLQALLRVKTIN